ncbi:MAG: alpha/beta hydrolase [Methylorubrum rhodinum]|uniref:alpha/beta hydrolase n=1 Tax=Methylorubrum rhodinum TaxID=29428 RepID=UPI003BB0AE3E
MALDPHVSRFLDMMALGGTGGIDLAARREGLRGLSKLAAAGLATGQVEVRDFTMPGPGGALSLRLYAPEGEAPESETSGPGLVFLHGGGLVTGDLDTHDALCRTLCDAGRMRVVAVEYRLAPEHPFPAALDDALAATRWVMEHAADLGIDPARLAVGGESAGAGLAARVCQEFLGVGKALAAQLLICPVLDVHGTGPSRRDFARGYFLDEATIQGDIFACGPDALPNPRFCPLRETELAGLPPAHIHTAEYDPVRDDGETYAERLTRAGVPVVHARHAGMIHFFYGLGRLVPRSRPILSQIARDFADLLRNPAPTA